MTNLHWLSTSQRFKINSKSNYFTSFVINFHQFWKNNCTQNSQIRSQRFWGNLQGDQKNMPIGYFKCTKICILTNSKTASLNLKSNFSYSYTKCPKIAIEITEKNVSSCFPFYLDELNWFDGSKWLHWMGECLFK